jgi:hypothetical protein
MGRYDAIKQQRGKIDISKLWFKDVQYIENTLNFIKSNNREIYFNYRMQISAMMFDLEECIRCMGNYNFRNNTTNRNIVEDKLSTLRTAVDDFDLYIKNLNKTLNKVQIANLLADYIRFQVSCRNFFNYNGKKRYHYKNEPELDI